MDMDADDKGLCLSLGFGTPPPVRRQQRRESTEAVEPTLTLSLSSSSDDASGRRPAATPKTNARLSSPHSTVSSFSTPYPSTVKREDAEVDDDDEDGSARKKLRLTKEQSALLEDRFREHSTLNPKQKQALAKQLNLRPRQVEVWFQNRRARTKLKQTEVDCEFLKRCCEALTEENRRLQKEVNELRSLKFSPPSLYMQMPAATLTVCPSCERLAAAVRDGPKPTTGLPPSNPHFVNPLNHSAAC